MSLPAACSGTDTTLEGRLPAATSRPAGRLAGTRALITGGNSGIGRVAAEALVREGARVVIAGRIAATLTLAANALRDIAAARDGSDDDVIPVVADVTQPADVDRLMDATRDAVGRLDVLFVNAGIGAFAPLERAAAEHFGGIFGVDVKGACSTVQRALPLLAPGASVIFTGSVDGSTGMMGAGGRSAFGAAVRSLARTLSAELEEKGVRVNVVSRGAVATPVWEKLDLSPEASELVRAHFATPVPVGRFGELRDIANAVVFLASDESRFVTGAEVVVGGGTSRL